MELSRRKVPIEIDLSHKLTQKKKITKLIINK